MLRDRAVVGVVLRHELRANLRAQLVWFAAIGALVAIVCALQPALAAGPLAAKVASLPASMRRGLGLELGDFARPASYLATNFTYVALGTALFGALLGARVIAKEEVQHTAEMLYAQPARRAAILAGKALAVALHVLALPAGLAVIALALLGAVAERPLEPALVASLFAGAACVALLFAGVGMLIAAVVRDARSAAGFAVGAVLVTFGIGFVAAMTPMLAPLRFASPLELAKASAIVTDGGLAPVLVIALIALGATSAVLAMRHYRTRDLHA